MGLFGKKKNLVGLDIGSSSIKAVELKAGKGDAFQLTTVGIMYLPQEAIVDGQIMDSTSVIEAIQRLFSEYKIKTQDVATAISGSSVIVKKIQLPSMSEQELSESIHWEAEQYIPFDINDVRLDYVILSDGGMGDESMEVLLVAVKRDKVNDYVSVISQSGKTPAIVDLDAFAVQNAYETNYDVDPDKVVALVNMGAGVTNINILSRGATVFWRDISFGGNQFSEALQREFNLSFDQAEQVKRGEDVEGCSAAEARTVLDAVSAEMASEIQKTFDFFAATASEDSVDELVVSGGCALTENLVSVLKERFGVSTELMNPLRRIHYRENDFDGQWLQSIAPMLTVSVGLAVRKIGE